MPWTSKVLATIMISVADIESLVRGGESESIEFKRTTGERREAARTVCAMLNHHGGRVVFGVEPGGRIIGQMVSDRTVEELAQELGEIEPPVFPGIERLDFASGLQLLVVTVSAGGSQPYSYRGHAYRRVGNTNRQLSREEYNRILLERLHGDPRWENHPAADWSVADLDHAEIIEAGGCVMVRFSPTRYVPPQRVAQNVTARQQRVLAVLSESGAGLALREVHERLGHGITRRQVRKDLEALRILGLTQSSGHGRGSRWRLS